MKTLKELLLERHRAAEPGLDLARGAFLARLGSLRSPLRRERRGFEHVWCENILPLRWHLAGMSAVWLVVLLLNVEPSPAPDRPIAKESLPTPRQLFTSLRQNRREILELTESPPVAPIPLPPRRSEVLPATAIA